MALESSGDKTPDKSHSTVSNDKLQPNKESITPGELKNQTKAATKKLVDSHIIPKVTFAEAHPEPKEPGEKPGTKPKETQTSPLPHKDWTVAVELGATLPGDPTNPKGWGAQAQLKELKKLAESTKGKSVNFVVHAEMPEDKKGDICDNKPDGESSACVTDAQSKNRAVTERFFIHDGKIEQLPDKKYKNGADSIKDLLAESGKLAPADKLGLIMQSHGMGTDGIATNLGEVSLDGTIGAIKDGLKKTGHEILDLLDYDSCTMSDVKVLSKSEKVATDLVASAAVEGVGKNSDGQNLGAALGSVLEKSKMSGQEFGDSIVEQAKAGKDGKGDDQSIDTLANFNMSHFSDFKTNLDKFGTELSTIAKSGQNMKQLVQDVEKAEAPSTGDPNNPPMNRDLKSFANTILDDIKAGHLKGDTKALEDAANKLIGSFDEMATNQFVNKEAGYKNGGGLTTEIPGKDALDRRELAKGDSPLTTVKQMTETPLDKIEFTDKQQLLKMLEEPMNRLDHGWSKRHPGELNQLHNKINEIAKSKDLAGMKTAVENLKDFATKLDDGPLGNQTREDMFKQSKFRQQELLDTPPQKVSPDWDKFIAVLKRTAH
jgi:hypothetical protein